MKYRGPHPLFWAFVVSLGMWAAILWTAHSILERVMSSAPGAQ